MALFLSDDVTKLLWNKFVVVIGDSNQRSVYKDLVNLLQNNCYSKACDLKTKGELSFNNDQLLHGGRKAQMMNGVNYREVRQYKTDYHLVRFYFVTRIHNRYVESIWEDLNIDPRPDVVIMNSCLWDVSRYGPTSMNKYKTNLEKTFQNATDALPSECLFIWNTALPVANKIKGGFLLPELDFLCSTLRLDVLEGNFYAKELAGAYGIDVLDLHYLFRYQLHRRAPDGVHWNHQAHRRITNLILTHIANAWGLDPPRYAEELSRGLPALPLTQEELSSGLPALPPPTRVPSPVPNPLNFINFDKPVQGTTETSKRKCLLEGKAESMTKEINSKEVAAKNSLSIQIDSKVEHQSKLLPVSEPDLLGSLPKQRPIPTIVQRHRQTNRYTPYNSQQMSVITTCSSTQSNQYNITPMPMGYHCPPQLAYQSANQYQVEMEWRRDQRAQRLLRDRSRELNWFGYNWST